MSEGGTPRLFPTTTINENLTQFISRQPAQMLEGLGFEVLVTHFKIVSTTAQRMVHEVTVQALSSLLRELQLLIPPTPLSATMQGSSWATHRITLMMLRCE